MSDWSRTRAQLDWRPAPKTALDAMERASLAARNETMSDQPTPEPLSPGVLFDQGSRTVEELDVLVVQLAVEYGFAPSGDTSGYELFAAQGELGDPDDLPDEELMDALENLREIAEEAIDFLNEHAAPEGYWIGHDGEAGAFGVWEVDEL